MKATGFFTTAKPVRGEYRETAVDAAKRGADMLLTSVDGNYYSLFINNPIEIKGRGVKRYSDKVYAVTEKVYDRLKSEYRIEMDF